MAVILSNPQEVPTPAPPARRYGLLTAASRLEMDARGAASGITWAAEDCGMTVVPYDPTCAPTPSPTKVMDEGQPFVESSPYWLIATYQCGTVGTTAADVSRRVRKRYDSSIQNALEATVWDGNGVAGVTPTLTAAPALAEVIPTAPGAGAAISALEAAFYALHGYVGTIHVNTLAEGALQYAGMLQRQGGAGVLTTPVGTKVSIGAGYGITGPQDLAPDAGFVYAFITPQTYLWESTVATPDPVQTLERTTNQWHGLAESVWMHGWLCDTVLAVQVPIAAPAVATAPAPAVPGP